ncbi:MAG TPA: 3-phytase, partial [Oceanospirillales bacterium]|nr:3-phytase [Oceanospirillales bacterium]
EFAVETQPEGCVADDLSGILYLGEENRAVWTIPAMPDTTTTPQLMVPVSDALVADIEGMGLYREEGRTLLVVSSQGNDSYVVYDTAAPYPMLGRFRVGMNAAAGIDGASETDGLEVTSMMLGEDFPRGLLVVQDGRNVMPAEHQNFKLISWEEIAPLLTQSSR